MSDREKNGAADDSQDDKGNDLGEIVEAALIVVDRALYEQYRRFRYAVQGAETAKVVKKGGIPHEEAIATFEQFCAYVEELREREPALLLARVACWRSGRTTVLQRLAGISDEVRHRTKGLLDSLLPPEGRE